MAINFFSNKKKQNTDMSFTVILSGCTSVGQGEWNTRSRYVLEHNGNVQEKKHRKQM